MSSKVTLLCDSHESENRLFILYDMPAQPSFIQALQQHDINKIAEIRLTEMTSNVSLMYFDEYLTDSNQLHIDVRGADHSVFQITKVEDFKVLLDFIVLCSGDTETAAKLFFEYWMTLPGNIIRAGAYV